MISFTKTLTVLILLLVMASCSLERFEKRHYRPGYHLEFANAKPKICRTVSLQESNERTPSGKVEKAELIVKNVPLDPNLCAEKSVASTNRKENIQAFSPVAFNLQLNEDSLKSERKQRRLGGFVIAGALTADTGVLAAIALPVSPCIFIGLGLLLIGFIFMMIGLRIKGHHRHDPFLAAGVIFLMILIPLYLLVKGIIDLLKKAGIVKKKAEEDKDIPARALWLELVVEVLLLAACLLVCYMLFFTGPIHIIYSPYAFLLFTVLLFFFFLITLGKLISYYAKK